MGYTTDFEGKCNITPTMKPEHVAYINLFSTTRRMERDAKLTAKRPDPVREAVGLPVGEYGGYFVGETGFMGQDDGPDISDHNHAPPGQPGLWCHWGISRGTDLEWNELSWDNEEKFGAKKAKYLSDEDTNIGDLLEV